MSAAAANGITEAGTLRAVQPARTRWRPRPRRGDLCSAGHARRQLTPALLGAG